MGWWNHLTELWTRTDTKLSLVVTRTWSRDGDSQQESETHPGFMSLITISHNPWWMASCHHHDRNDGDATSGGETLDKTNNNQSINHNMVTVAHNIVLGSWEDLWMRPYWSRTWYMTQKMKYGVTAPGQALKTQFVLVILVGPNFSLIWYQSH
jgi:hypothetical protein